MLGLLPQIPRMTPWEIIEEALRRRKPARSPQWLADQLGKSIQTVMNWKARRVPPKEYRAIANVLSLTIDQIEGQQPLPWDMDTDWPFPDIDRARFYSLTEMQRGAIQQKVADAIHEYETQRPKPGKLSTSREAAAA